MARKRYQNRQVLEALTEIFKSVADYVDGDCYSEDIKGIVESYETAMKKPSVLEFYSELVRERSIEMFGESE